MTRRLLEIAAFVLAVAAAVMARPMTQDPAPDPTKVIVTGEVRAPGAYSLRPGTTVLQLLSLAGGATRDAALNRTTITRIDGDQRVEVKRVKLTDIMRPGDTLKVPRHVRAGSILQIDVENQAELSGRYLVQPDGTIIFGKIGRVMIRSVESAALLISQVLTDARIAVNPKVTITAEK